MVEKTLLHLTTSPPTARILIENLSPSVLEEEKRMRVRRMVFSRTTPNRRSFDIRREATDGSPVLWTEMNTMGFKLFLLLIVSAAWQFRSSFHHCG